jgi:hypothetical protein
MLDIGLNTVRKERSAKLAAIKMVGNGRLLAALSVLQYVQASLPYTLNVPGYKLCCYVKCISILISRFHVSQCYFRLFITTIISYSS